ncbi:MAG: hypothetical protein C0624_01660 [Desulfuromonas sp.]|nr:MAG: hypothetical protein C0624_01660 [Desulfuromonas sp.]
MTRACVDTRRENFGEMLVAREVASVEAICDAVQVVLASDGETSLAQALAEKRGVAQEKVDGLAKEAVEGVVYSFFAWEEGTFSFALGEDAELEEGPFHPLHFVFAPGLNPQWLAMEGSRILDEKRHRGESPDVVDDTPPIEALQALMPGKAAAPPAPVAQESSEVSETAPPQAAPEAPVEPPAEAPAETSSRLYVIDDDEVTRGSLAEVFDQFGVHSEFFAEAPAFLEALAQTSAGVQPIAVIDLIMPRADGSGILGGLELLENVRQAYPELAVVIISDHPNPEAAEKIRAMGVADLLLKPKKSEVRTPEGQEALSDLAATVVARLQSLSSPELVEKRVGSDMFNLGEEMRLEFGDTDADFVPARGPQSPGLHLLRGMLAELQNPALGGGIILLVLRFASELMNRAVIFVVKDDAVAGLGQFGIESNEEPADVLVRKMSIPRDTGSVFDRLIEEMCVQRLKLGDNEWDNYLRSQLGGGDPAEVFLGPIISEGKVVAVLYGDNLPEATPVGDTESLEIFLSQAGIAMEKALLERRLRVKSDD